MGLMPPGVLSGHDPGIKIQRGEHVWGGIHRHCSPPWIVRCCHGNDKPSASVQNLEIASDAHEGKREKREKLNGDRQEESSESQNNLFPEQGSMIIKEGSKLKEAPGMNWGRSKSARFKV